MHFYIFISFQFSIIRRIFASCMLTRLEIQNYAIIDRVDISLPEGLTIITGETGAGKSILLGALGLVMGKRADTKVMYDPEKKCYVEAVFEISNYNLRDYFEARELDYFPELIIRREISQGGKSRAFVNDSPVTLDILAELTENLIDIHQQFDILDIQKPTFQLRMIDALAGNQSMLDAYKTEYNRYRSLIRKLSELTERSAAAAREMDFLTFQIQEFDEAALKTGEQAELESALLKLTAAEDVKRLTTLVSHVLEEDERAVNGTLQSLASQLSHIRDLDPVYHELYERLLSSREELADIAREASRISDLTEYDTEAIHTTTERLNVIYRLMKKHQAADLDDLLLVRDKTAAQLAGFRDLGTEIESTSKEILSIKNTLLGIGTKLSENRKACTGRFESEVHSLLADLSMTHARIKVAINALGEPGPTGLDEVNMLFAPNKGSDFLPLKDTASGGEMSRLTLCIKSLVAGAITLPTLIFDEIDAGVSGDVAGKVGKILSRLAERHQVICITHSPQIAARASCHYWVYKSDTDTRTITAMKQLSADEKITEIAKMLSGNPPTDAALANARELINLT